MLKEINLLKKKHIKDEKDEYETCIICKCKTNIRRDQPIKDRYGYVEGAGQLCYRCYKKLYHQTYN